MLAAFLALSLLALAAADRRDEAFMQCCEANGMGECASALCHYNADTAASRAASMNCPYLKCYKTITEYIRCATDYREARDCYDKNEVPEFCRDTIGSGDIPDLDELFADGKRYMLCIRHLNQMLACHKAQIPETGHTNICLEKCENKEETLTSEGAIKNFILFTKLVRKTCGDKADVK